MRSCTGDESESGSLAAGQLECSSINAGRRTFKSELQVAQTHKHHDVQVLLVVTPPRDLLSVQCATPGPFQSDDHHHDSDSLTRSLSDALAVPVSPPLLLGPPISKQPLAVSLAVPRRVPCDWQCHSTVVVPPGRFRMVQYWHCQWRSGCQVG